MSLKFSKQNFVRISQVSSNQIVLKFFTVIIFSDKYRSKPISYHFILLTSKSSPTKTGLKTHSTYVLKMRDQDAVPYRFPQS
jgi:hypothetical protein